MKRIGILIILLMPMMHLSAQPRPFPRGIYTSLESLREGRPDRTDTLDVVNQGHNNPFLLEQRSKAINRSFIRNEILAYVHDGLLFLNGNKMGLRGEYWLASSQGQYIAFYYHDPTVNSGTIAAGVLFGVAGALIAEAVSKNSTDQAKVLYILSLKTGNAKRLGPNYITARLEEYCPELVEPFKQEFDNTKEDVLIRYLQMLNDAFAKQTQK